MKLITYTPKEQEVPNALNGSNLALVTVSNSQEGTESVGDTDNITNLKDVNPEEESLPLDGDFINPAFYNSLPETINAYLNLYEGREKDIVLLSLLTGFSSLTPFVKGNYRGELHYPNLYLFFIAPPGLGKGKMKNPISILYKCIEDFSHKYIHFRMPGNSSAIRVIEKLNACNGLGNLMFETEADSISGIKKTEWGNFSDILRKAAQHEEISVSRKGGDVDLFCKKPRLTLLISGTQNQLYPFIDSVHNGLFSRILFYTFNEIGNWQAYEEKLQQDDVIRNIENYFYDKYIHLLDKNVAFKFSREQQIAYDTYFKNVYDEVITNDVSLNSSIERLGYNIFRIMMMLSLLEKDEHLEEETITDNAFNTALLLVPTFVYHIFSTKNIYRGKVVGMKDLEKKFLDTLPDTFTRKETIADVCSKLKISTKTYANYIDKLVAKGLLEKTAHGAFKKVT